MATQVSLNSGAVSSAGSLKLQTNGTTDAVTIDTSQNVGIGTTSPAQKLDVSGQALVTNLYLRSDDSDVSWGAGSGSRPLIRGNTTNNTLQFYTASTERARIDSSGSFGIGTTSPSSRLHVYTASGTADVRIQSNTYASSFSLYAGAGGANAFGIYDNNASAYRATIDSSGNLLVAKTTTSLTTTGWNIGVVGTGNQVFNITSSNEAMTYNNNNSTGATYLIDFRQNNSQKGYIAVSSTAVTYSTSSDYRLKNSVAPMTGALAKIAALKPVIYKWNSDGSHGEGFIAHELAEVCPHAVTGEKDAVDADGNPKYQGIDTSFLVATLTAAIQEQQAIIQQLQADVAALKG